MRSPTTTWVPPWLQRGRSFAGDVVLALVVLLAALRVDGMVGPGQGPWVAGLIVVLIMLRRWYPMTALAAGTAAVVINMIVAWPSAGGLILLLGTLTYSATLYGARRRPWHYASAVFITVMVTGSVLHFSDWWSPALFGLYAWIFGGAGVGDSVRMRRAYIAEVTERARQAEQNREELARRRVIDERVRIARELHDVVAHHIAVISVHAGAAEFALKEQPEKVWPVLGHIRQAADTVLEEIKSVIGVLRDPNEVLSTEPAPGLDRLPALLDSLRAMDFQVRLAQQGTPRKLPSMVDLAAYRIVQEALTNAHRYGDGAAALEITWSPGMVAVEVTNKLGRPGDRHRAGSGFGLLGMRERAAAAHGTISAGLLAGGRFRVRAELPAEETALHWDEPTVQLGTV